MAKPEVANYKTPKKATKAVSMEQELKSNRYNERCNVINYKVYYTKH